MRSQEVSVLPLAVHLRRRALVLKGSFPALSRTGGPGYERPLDIGAEHRGHRPASSEQRAARTRAPRVAEAIRGAPAIRQRQARSRQDMVVRAQWDSFGPARRVGSLGVGQIATPRSSTRALGGHPSIHSNESGGGDENRHIDGNADGKRFARCGPCAEADHIDAQSSEG